MTGEVDIFGHYDELRKIFFEKLINNTNRRLSPRTSINEKSLHLVRFEIRDEHLIVLTFEATSYANDTVTIEAYLVMTICTNTISHQNKLYKEYVDTVRLTVSELYEKVSKKFGKDKVETTELLKEILS